MVATRRMASYVYSVRVSFAPLAHAEPVAQDEVEASLKMLEPPFEYVSVISGGVPLGLATVPAGAGKVILVTIPFVS